MPRELETSCCGGASTSCTVCVFRVFEMPAHRPASRGCIPVGSMVAAALGRARCALLATPGTVFPVLVAAGAIESEQRTGEPAGHRFLAGSGGGGRGATVVARRRCHKLSHRAESLSA